MKRFLFVMLICCAFALAACGSESEENTAYEPIDIQVESADGAPVFSVIYDIDNTDTEAWHGYDSEQIEVDTAINGIKSCMKMDEWADNAVVYGYGKEAKLKNLLYQYGDNGIDGDYESIKLFQVGIYNEDYVLNGELD